MDFDWDDLKVFLAVNREGTLSAAAKNLKVSQPTVGRRLHTLEEVLSTRLFDRLPTGFVTTSAGLELMPLAEQMEQVADAIARKQVSFADRVSGTVRISAYELVTQYLITRLPILREQLPDVELEFSVAHLSANLSRREADLQIRECLPDSPGLISRKLGGFASAVYGANDYIKFNPDAMGDNRFLMCDWIGMDDDHTYFPGQRWMRERLGQRLPSIRSNNAIVLQDSVKAGVGLAVLPCFSADVDPVLRRVTPPISESYSTLYLLVHEDMRRSPAVRAVMDALINLFAMESNSLDGLLPD